MPHAAIVGVTTSGKTFLARSIARGMRTHGVPTLVLHKAREPWNQNEATWQTSDPEQFLARFALARSHACFMELADAAIDKFDGRFHRCFTEGRHDGHRCFYLTQRAASVHPAIRENCESLYLFTVGAKGAALWAEEFGDAELLRAVNLPQFNFFHKPNRYTPAVRRVLLVNQIAMPGINKRAN